MNIDINKLIRAVEKSAKKGVGFKELTRAMGVKSADYDEFKKLINRLIRKDKITEKKKRYYVAPKQKSMEAVITRVQKTFGFAKLEKNDVEFFIPGKFLMGALPGDRVNIKQIKGRGESPEGQVVSIIEEGNSEFTGVLVNYEGVYFIEPDSIVKSAIRVSKSKLHEAEVGDKVLAKISFRGNRHSEHKAEIICSYGSAENAAACAESILSVNHVGRDFAQSIIDSASEIKRKGIRSKDLIDRVDLRSDIIFTIDGADSKDLDDAVSLEKYDDCYVLGVHIADVSHYVKQKSELDNEAFMRGTSIYYANKVIPMLPKQLSNGICSLNPNEDRLTLSAIMTLDLQGNLEDFEFKKSVICSRVKGVYTEVNEILNDKASEEIKEKYAAVQDKVFLMKELADIRTALKKQRGAPEIQTTESKIIIENEVAVDIKARDRGESEIIIEEFMLLANEACAMVGKIKEIPFIYRVHENPNPEKLETLKNTLSLLGISVREFTENVKPKVLSDILDKTKDLPVFPIVNVQVLRSMAKAKYSENPIGHYGLALENYSHFTSPIRRYPDLVAHRIISDVLIGMNKKEITKKYEKWVDKASKQATQTEINAMKIERECEDCYKAEYMSAHLGETFTGLISSVAKHGVYVELPNSVEGLVSVHDFPEGEYDFDEVMSFRNILNGESYKIGDTVTVKCVKAEVSSGNIDFIFV